MNIITAPERDSAPSTATIGKFSVKASENGYWDRNRYSKGWHRNYGGVWTVESRTVEIRRPWGNGELKRTVSLDGWRGDWLAKAVIEAGLQPKKYHAPKYVRLNDAYDAKLLATKRGYKIFERSLLGHRVDFCIVAPDNTTYHAERRSDLIAGLKNKLSAKNAKKLNGLIDWDFVKSLGFCDAGIKEFIEITGLSRNGQYTPEQIHDAVLKVGFERVAHFESELRTLADATNYQF